MKNCNIRDYGAKTCDKPQTEAIQKAIDDCFLQGGGRVIIPRGLYVTGDIRLRSGVELYLETGAILKGVSDPAEYFHWQEDTLQPVGIEEISTTDKTKSRSAVATSRWSNGLIRAFDAENIAVIGEKGSYIDGSNVFDPEGEEHYRGPHGMSIWRCKNIKLEGYTFIHSGNWCHAIFKSQNITVRDIKVYGGHDGFDVRTCDNVSIENCLFDTGDDCIAGYDNHDVAVRDCILNSACQAIRFGGNNVLFENCVSGPASFGFRKRLSEEEKRLSALTHNDCRHEVITSFSYYCDFRAPLRRPAENIILRNCHFSQAFELPNLQFDGKHVWCCNRSLREITFENCTFDKLSRPSILWGDEKEKLICTFRNCLIRAREDFETQPIVTVANFEKMLFEDVKFEGYLDPTIEVGSDDTVELVRSTPVTIKRI